MLPSALRQSRIKLGFALLAILSVTIFATACGGGDNDSDVSALSSQLEAIQLDIDKLGTGVDDLHNSIQHTQVFTARVAFLEADMHAIDEDMQIASEIPTGFLTRIRQMEQAAASADWPDELKGLADDMAAKLADAGDALQSEVLADAKGAVTIAHAAWHNWDAAAVEYLTGGGHDEDDHEAE